jgi:hypothetical protein
MAQFCSTLVCRVRSCFREDFADSSQTGILFTR